MSFNVVILIEAAGPAGIWSAVARVFADESLNSRDVANQLLRHHGTTPLAHMGDRRFDFVSYG